MIELQHDLLFKTHLFSLLRTSLTGLTSVEAIPFPLSSVNFEVCLSLPTLTVSLHLSFYSPSLCPWLSLTLQNFPSSIIFTLSQSLFLYLILYFYLLLLTNTFSFFTDIRSVMTSSLLLCRSHFSISRYLILETYHDTSFHPPFHPNG